MKLTDLRNINGVDFMLKEFQEFNLNVICYFVIQNLLLFTLNVFIPLDSAQ